MIKDFFAKLRKGKKTVQKSQSQSVSIEPVKKEEPKGEIVVTNEGNIYKVVVSGYVSISDFIDKKNSSEEYGVLDKMPSGILLNNTKINEGIYYIIENNNCLYNILLSGRTIRIHEREKKEINEEEKQIICKNLRNDNIDFGDCFYQDRYLSFSPNNNDYSFSYLRHKSDFDTYYTKYYKKDKKFDCGNLELSDKEAYDEIKEMISRLEGLDGLNQILDFNQLNTLVMEDLKEKIGMSL